MTVTLTSAGGTSLITDGTGPALEIKGLTGELRTTIQATGTSLSSQLKTTRACQRFFDNFEYHTYGNLYLLSDADNPFMKSTIWYPEGITGIGLDIVTVEEYPDYGNGVVRFAGSPNYETIWVYPIPPPLPYSYSSYYGIYKMTARNAPISIYNNQVVYEAKIMFSDDTFLVRLGFRSSIGKFTGFFFDNYTPKVYFDFNDVNQGVHTIAYDQWLTVKMVIEGTSVTFSVNGTSYGPYTVTAINNQCFPYIYNARANNNSGSAFYIDYIDVVNNSTRY